METEGTESAQRTTSSGSVAGFLLGSLILGIGAVIASFAGRFLSFGASASTKSDGTVTFLMGLAVYGPFLILAIIFFWGLYRVNNGRSIWWLFPVGIGALMFTFTAVGALIGN